MKTLGRTLARKTVSRVRGQLYLDRRADHRRTVFIAGSGRSGTTWIADLLNHRNEYRHISEPFHRKNVPLAAPFAYRQYLRPDDDDPRYLEPARRILSGRVRTLWTDKYNRRMRVDRRLVKEVRANLFLKWLRVHFPEMPMVFVLRHPCAVAASRMRIDWEGGTRLRSFLEQPSLVRDHLEPFEADLAEADSKGTEFERMIHFWCVENLVPLRQLGPGDVHIAFYERLVTQPEEEIRRLFDHVGSRFDPSVLDAAGRPSMASRKDSAIVSGGDLVGGWRRHLSEDQVGRAVEILAAFGLERIYGADPEPVPSVPEDSLAV